MDKDINKSEVGGDWIVLGSVPDKMLADHVLETLRSNNIKAVLQSRAGFFGDMGLTMTSVFGTAPGAYQISVPVEQVEEATGIAKMIAGDSWESTAV